MSGDARGWPEALVAGATVGLVESVLTYGTGRVHAADVVPIFAFDLVLGFLFAFVILNAVTRGALPWRRSFRRPALAAIAYLLVCAGGAFAFARAHGGIWERPVPPVAATADAVDPRLSVLLVTLDTVRADHLSLYGYARETTPNLRKLAGESLVVERAWSASPYTLASHASLFTGLLPSQHGAHPLSFSVRSLADEKVTPLADAPLPRGSPTLASDLLRRGYRTGAIVANGAYLARWTGLDQGFEYYDANTSELRFGYVPAVVRVAGRFAPRLYRKMTYAPQWRAPQITNAAQNWLTDVGNQPFFLFLNYLDAHPPYSKAAALSERFRPGGLDCTDVSFKVAEEDVLAGKRDLSQRERECLLSQYDASIFAIDAELGRLVEWLRARARLERTLIVITSDHGEHFGEHQLMGHDNSLFQELLRVPLLVRDPRRLEGHRVPGPIALSDLRAWILATLDAPRWPESPGPWPRVIAEHWTRERLRRRDPERFKHAYSRAIYSDPFQLIDERASQRLYDLSRDPSEAEELLARAAPGALETARALLSAVPAPPDPDRVRPGANADAAALERLRALGYLE